ncbi:MAG: DUF4351 domain-containing protein [Leptolyngbyaceae cyanobacterium]
MSGLILRQLHHRFGDLPESVITRVNELSLAALDELAESLLDFETIDEAIAWLFSQIKP